MNRVSEMTERSTEVLVIGAGPGGYVAAIRAAQLGKSVTIVEKGELGGVCLNRGCIPSKALITAAKTYELFSKSRDNPMGVSAGSVTVDFRKVQTWKQGIVDRLSGGILGLLQANRVNVIRGEASFLAPDAVEIREGRQVYAMKFQSCVIATGSRPVELPAFPFGGKILSSTEVLRLSEIPGRLVVIGGGYIGVELSQAFARLGTRITMLEGQPRILPGLEEYLSSLVVRKLRAQGAAVVTGAKAEKAELTDDGIAVTYTVDGKSRIAEGDYLFVAVGRKPNTDRLNLDKAGVAASRGWIDTDRQCRTSNPNIFAIGDVVSGPQLAHKASYEAKVAAEAIAGLPTVVDYRAIPAVVFSEPEIAVVGMTETEAKARGIDVMIGKFSYGANGRALTMNDAQGFVKLIAERATGQILGGQVVGSEASDLIAEITLAIELGCHVRDLALTVHAHPTLSEMIMEAGEDAEGMCIHSAKGGKA